MEIVGDGHDFLASGICDVDGDRDIVSNDDPLEIGSRSDSDCYFYGGYISQVRLWSRALTPSEVEQQFLEPGSADPTGLIGSCPLYTLFGFRTCRMSKSET